MKIVKWICFFFTFALIFNGLTVLKSWAGTPFQLYYPGLNGFIDYSKYGRFYGVGTADYKYVLTDPTGLAQVSEEGVYPNTDSVFQDPNYFAVKDKLQIPTDTFGVWEGDPDTPQVNLFRWATSKQDPAAKTFFVAKCYEDAQMWIPALKAYYAVLVQFPAVSRPASTDLWTWYLNFGESARVEILYILRNHPELGIELKDADIDIDDAGKTSQKINRIHPGYFVRATNAPPPPLTTVVQVRGTGKVKLVEYQNHQWIMTVDGQPYFIKGLGYDCTKIGESPDMGTLINWCDTDSPQGVFDSWVDKNHNNQRDADETVVGDPALLKYMGCNTIRIYSPAKSKKTLKRFWDEAGIRFAMGVYFGAYAQESGATWDAGTDYTDPDQQDHMLKVIKDMVMEYKDEPYTLCWILGNENNYGVHNNAPKYTSAYLDLMERAVQMIHQLDPDHPVASCLGDLGFMDQLPTMVPDLDIIGINAYRGAEGFGDMWQLAEKKFDRPVMLTEFGCGAFRNGMGEDQKGQAEYLTGNWKDIAYNRGGGKGEGNSIGGLLFEWMDEWWKAGNVKPPTFHDTSAGQGHGAFMDGMDHEEWYGLCSMGNGNDSPRMRELRQSYWDIRNLWLLP